MYNGTIKMIEQTALDKGILVFKNWAHLRQATQGDMFDGNLHLDSQARVLTAEHDAAIAHVVDFFAAVRMVAHETCKSGGYIREFDDKLVDQRDVLANETHPGTH